MKKVISLMLCSLMVLGLTQNVVNAEESTGVQAVTIPEDQIIRNDESGIPDEELYRWCLESADKNKDNILTKDEALLITGKDGTGEEISYGNTNSHTISLKGLSYFKNLEEFGYGESGGWEFYPNKHITFTHQDELLKLEKLNDLFYVYVDNIDLKIISQLKNLETFSVICSSFSNKGDLSLLSNNLKLNEIWFRSLNEGLNAYDLDMITNYRNLTNLRLDGNKLSSLKPLSKLSSTIKYLSLSNNKISDISALLNLVNLETIDVSQNELITLPNLEKLVNLKGKKTLNNDNYYSSFRDNFLTEEELREKLPAQLANDEEFIKMQMEEQEVGTPEIDKPVTDNNLEKPYDKTLTEIPNDLVDKIYDSKDGVSITLSNAVKIDKNIFEVASKEGKTICFEVVDSKGEVEYSWTFNGAHQQVQNNQSVDLSLSFNSDKKQEIEKLTAAKDNFYLNFAHHGDLPMNAKMKVKVDSKYNDGDGVYLYYFNEEKNTVETMNNLPLIVKDGYVEFEIYHCSTYFLSQSKIGEENKEKPTHTTTPPKTSDETSVVYLISAMGVATLCMYMFRKRKSN